MTAIARTMNPMRFAIVLLPLQSGLAPPHEEQRRPVCRRFSRPVSMASFRISGIGVARRRRPRFDSMPDQQALRNGSSA
jgi:hypothetical protein